MNSLPKKIDWSDKFFTGQREVDLQHQYFAELINRIIWEVMEVNDIKYHQLLIEELMLYAHFHFKSEENILLRLNYQDLQTHKRLHRELIDSLSARVNIINEGAENSIILIDFIVKWFMEHTLGVDISSFAELVRDNKT